MLCVGGLVALAVVLCTAEVLQLMDRVAGMGSVWAWSVGLCAGVLLIGAAWLIVREIRGWLAVRRVDRVRAVLEGSAVAGGVTVLRRWARSLPASLAGSAAQTDLTRHLEASDLQQAIATTDVLLRELDAQADCHIRRESAKTGLLVSLSGVAALDSVICLWRSARLMRQVASTYGARPGAIGTLRLARMVLVHAIAVDLSQHAADVVSTRVGPVAAAGGQGLLAATLTARLGLWTQQVCRPASKPRRSVAGFAAGSAADEVAHHVRKTVQRAARVFRVRADTQAGTS
ncbi:MAG: DUF697 domain-containing protein [Phycisphaerales bacterium]|jgi:putative membrane protein|nr:DUF697 domain-containing protein [Phycisphaerales bacterium]